MIAVIFEVEPAGAVGRETYLSIAASLAEDLKTVDGFLSVERFESLATPGKLLSLSFWRDEAAIADWRNRERHRAAQTAGRSGVFERYRLSIATVDRDYNKVRRDQAPDDSRVHHA